MKSIACVLLLAFAAAGADAACNYPKAPEHIPNGETATKEEMLAAQKEVRGYNDAMTQYLECIGQEHEAALKSMDEEMAKNGAATDSDREAHERRKKELTRKQDQKHNAAVDELNSVADRFNQEVRAFQKKQSG